MPDRKRAVYLREEQWLLLDALLAAALIDIAKDLRVSSVEPASEAVLSWSQDRISEIRDAIKAACGEPAGDD